MMTRNDPPRFQAPAGQCAQPAAVHAAPRAAVHAGPHAVAHAAPRAAAHAAGRALSLVALLALATLGACSAAPQGADDAAAVARERDAVWRQLLAAHDRNGDGSIARSEHDRDHAAFASLDRDGDEVLTRADLDVPLTMPPDLTAPMLLVRAFGEPNLDGVDAAAIERGFALVDADGDEQLTREEFMALPRLAGLSTADVDRFATLIAAVRGARVAQAAPADTAHATSANAPGARGAGTLGLAELLHYLVVRDTDGDGRLVRRERLLPGAAPADGWFPAGTRDLAPDFTARRVLSGSDEPGPPLTLSKLRGRQVALIFGSYT